MAYPQTHSTRTPALPCAARSCSDPDFAAAYPSPLPDGRTAVLNVTYSVPEEEVDLRCRGPKLRGEQDTACECGCGWD